MVGLIRAEFRKMVRRKLLWMLMLVLVVLIGVLALAFFLIARVAEGDAVAGLSVPQRPEAYLFGVQQVVGQTWVPLILAAVLLGGEFAKGTWSTSLTWEARRFRHLAAKFIAYTVGAWGAAIVGIAFWAVVTILFAEGQGGPSFLEWIVALLKVALVQGIWVMLGLALAALLRSTALAVGIGLAFSFAEGFLTLWRPYQTVALSINTTALFGDALGGDPATNPFAFEFPSVGQAIIVVLVWGAVCLAAAVWSVQARDA